MRLQPACAPPLTVRCDEPGSSLGMWRQRAELCCGPPRSRPARCPQVSVSRSRAFRSATPRWTCRGVLRERLPRHQEPVPPDAEELDELQPFTGARQRRPGLQFGRCATLGAADDVHRYTSSSYSRWCALGMTPPCGWSTSLPPGRRSRCVQGHRTTTSPSARTAGTRLSGCPVPVTSGRSGPRWGCDLDDLRGQRNGVADLVGLPGADRPPDRCAPPRRRRAPAGLRSPVATQQSCWPTCPRLRPARRTDSGCR